jgi:hypothetical protein
MLWTGIMPLRAVAFQILFLLVAIAIEAMILHVKLGLNRQQSVRYAVMINLLTTVVGWMIFFIVEPWLPEYLRSMLIGFVFFGIRDIPPMVIMLGFGIFLGTFLLKVQGMDLLDILMEETPTNDVPPEERGKFRGRKRRRPEAFTKLPNRPLAVLWANAASFTAISLLLVLRYFV